MSEVSKILPKNILNGLRQLKTLIFKTVDSPPPKKQKSCFFCGGGILMPFFFTFSNHLFGEVRIFFYGTHLGHFSRTFLVLGRYSLFISFMMCLMQLNEQFCYKMQSTHVCEKKFSHTQHKIH